MTIKRPDELWQEYCDVAPGIRERYGVASALSYVAARSRASLLGEGDAAADGVLEQP